VPKHRRGTTTAPAAALAAALLLAAGATGAVARGEGLEELNNLDINMPNTLDDAFAAERGSVTLLGAARYDNRRGHDNTVRLFPRLLVGVAEGLQATVQVPYTVGFGPGDDHGVVSFGALYNFNRETAWLPAFAVSVEGGPAVGPGAHGGELRLFGIASKTVDPQAFRRLHLNLAWFRRFDPGEEERRDRYRVALGYSQLLSRNTALVADYLRESQEERGERAANILEAGLRYRVAPNLILGGALGAGIGRDSPRFRAIVSVQFALSGGR
jgi:hypothetical protein